MDRSPAQSPIRENTARQLPVWGLAVALVACAIAYVLIAFLNMPLPAAWIVTGVLCWLLLYWARLNRWGLTLWCLATFANCATFQDAFSAAPQNAGTRFWCPFGQPQLRKFADL
jgi:hypothetical protein